MYVNWLRNLLPRFAPRRTARQTNGRPLARPNLVQLEDRTVPADITLGPGDVLIELDTSNEAFTIASQAHAARNIAFVERPLSCINLTRRSESMKVCRPR